MRRLDNNLFAKLIRACASIARPQPVVQTRLQRPTALRLVSYTPRRRNAIRTVERDGLPVPKSGSLSRASQTILVAEDDPLFLRLLQARLQGWGFRVITAKDGTEAWQLLQDSNTPDLLILDWIMPGVDGIELCRRIRAVQKDRYHYILLVSGKDDKQDVIAGLEAGADDYLTKPFDVGELKARLRTGTRILTLQHELIQAREVLRFQATHDDLTGLWSRATTLHLLNGELERGLRSRTSTGILMIDLDHFKSVNDTYGHLKGDTVLKAAGRRIIQSVRTYDFVGRYGGEEFLVVLSNCTADQLLEIAERARTAFARKPISTDAEDVQVTVSIGGVVASGDNGNIELLSVADSALYEAKRTGRNRVVIGSSSANRGQQRETGGSQLTTARK
jgi:diguanylate cyclase (GGDEF)-like protein